MKILLLTLLLSFSLTALGTAQFAFAQAPDPAQEIPLGKKIRKAFNITSFYAGFTTTRDQPRQDPFLGFFGAYINGIFGFMGILYLIWIILGGWWWMTSSGNEERIMKAKKTLLHSSVGIGIIIFAMVITNVVLSLMENALIGA